MTAVALRLDDDAGIFPDSIELGNYRDTSELRSALAQADCALSDCAKEMLQHPRFKLEHQARRIELVLLSPRALGMTSGDRIERIYDRAFKRGYAFCPAEVGPQLRLQYRHQPMGEALRIAMRPIEQYRTEEVFLIAHNDGGLVLDCAMGSDLYFMYSVDSRFVFTRDRRVG